MTTAHKAWNWNEVKEKENEKEKGSLQTKKHLCLTFEEFQTVLKLWKSYLQVDYIGGFGMYERQEISEGKLLQAKISCEIEEEEDVYFLCDKSMLRIGDCCTVFTSKGIRSHEVLTNYYYYGKASNFISWSTFINGRLLSRETESIYLDAEYIVNGLNNAKRLFYFLHTFQVYFALTPPFNFFLPSSSLPNEVHMNEKDLRNVQSMVNKTIKRRSATPLFDIVLLAKKGTKNSQLQSSLSRNDVNEHFFVFKKGKEKLFLTNNGLHLYNKKHDQYKHVSWNAFHAAKALMSSKKCILLDEKYFCFYDEVLFFMLRAFHCKLTLTFTVEVCKPPSYDFLAPSPLPPSLPALHQGQGPAFAHGSNHLATTPSMVHPTLTTHKNIIPATSIHLTCNLHNDSANSMEPDAVTNTLLGSVNTS